VTAHPAFTQQFVDELVTPGIRVPLTSDPDLFVRAAKLGRYLIWAATYGAVFADPAEGRPLGNTTYSTDDPRRVRNLTSVGVGLPEKITYDKAAQTIYLGGGSFSPVTERVWNYDVGGMKVVKHWFDYRKANPSGKKSSPLDSIHAAAWPIEWVREFNQLLTVLRRISELEPDQAELLARIIDGPIITQADLVSDGVRFPTNPKERRPRFSLHNEMDEQEGTLL